MDLRSVSRAITLNRVIWCVAVVSVIQNVRLVNQVKAYERIAYPPPLDAGNQLHRVVGFDMEGNRAELDLTAQSPGHRMLIMTMSPGCPICVANESSWAALASEARRKPDWRVVWLSRDPISITKKYFEDNGLGSTDVLAEPTNLTHRALRMYAVPYTIVVDDHGIVQKIWAGALTPDTIREISQVLSI